MLETCLLAALLAQTIQFQGDAPGVRDMAASGAHEVEAFFGSPFPGPIHFQIVASRAEFDGAIKKFGIPSTDCWMVGLGVADLMVLLSPVAWTKQACEHDARDTAATRQLIAHELVHVYHGQHNASRDFSAVDGLDWFVEGLAVFASGQLSKDRLERMNRDKLPGSLADDATHASALICCGPSAFFNRLVTPPSS